MKNVLIHYPLWVLVTIWWLLKKQTPQAVKFERMYDQAMIALIELLEAMEEVNERGKVETWLIRRLIGWYDRQREALREMKYRGVTLVGTLEK